MPALVGLSGVSLMEKLKDTPRTRGNPFEVDDKVESSASSSSIDWGRFVEFSSDGSSGVAYNGSPQ